MQFERDRKQPAAWLKATACLFLMGVMALVPACGDDDGGDGGGTPQTNEQVFASGMRGLAQFGSTAATSDEFAIMAALSGPLTQILPAARTFADEVLYAPNVPQAAKTAVGLAPRLVESPHAVVMAGIAENFGVYICDPQEPYDPDDPLPGWVKLEETPNPANSVVLRFDDACAVQYADHQGNVKTATGEIRMLNVVEDTGDPQDPNDDVPLQFVLEIAAGPEGPAPAAQPKIFRAPWNATLGANRDIYSLTIGSPTATTVADPTAAFLGTLLFHVVLSTTETGVEVSLGLYDSTQRYALVAGATIEGTLDAVESLTLDFGFGQTNDPSKPPFLFEITASNFQDGGGTLPLADISGAISYNDRALATFMGSTEFVPLDFDVNGDDVVDENDTCPNIDVTFTDTEETGNICAYMEQLVALIGGLPIGPTKVGLN